MPQVILNLPEVVVFDKGVRYEVEVIVGNQRFRHFSYTSLDDVVAQASTHVDEIHAGFANIEAWKAAHGGDDE